MHRADSGAGAISVRSAYRGFAQTLATNRDRRLRNETFPFVNSFLVRTSFAGAQGRSRQLRQARSKQRRGPKGRAPWRPPFRYPMPKGAPRSFEPPPGISTTGLSKNGRAARLAPRFLHIRTQPLRVICLEPSFGSSLAGEHLDVLGIANLLACVDVDKGVCAHRSSRRPLKNGWRTFPAADLARYSISASNSGSTQMPLCAIRLVLGWVFSDQGRQALAQFGG